MEGYVLTFYDLFFDRGSVDVYRDELAQQLSGFAQFDAFKMEVEVFKPGKESLEGCRERVQRDVVILVEMIDMSEMVNDKIETGGGKVSCVILFVELRIESAHMDLL
jgi:hypothetical protein